MLARLLALLATLPLLAAACQDDDGNAPPATEAPGTATAAATAQSSATAPGPTPTTLARAAGPAEHEGSRALDHVKYLAETIGTRVSGTASERETTDYIGSQFASSGYSVEVMEFEFEGDRFQGGSITAGSANIDAVAVAGGAGGKVTGKAVYVGLADEAGIASRDLHGAIAIADRGTLRFAAKLDNVVAAGATGLVFINNEEGLFNGTLGKTAGIPVMAVTLEDGPRLRDAATRGENITIDAPDAQKSKAANVIARPSEDAECEIIVGGHHDSVPGVPAANDNASGSANVIELARAFAVDGLDEGLCFATFGAEESGLYGSQALADRLKNEGELPQFMVNLDVTGIGDLVEVIGTPDLRSRALRLAEDLGIPAVPSSLPANTGSDHQSFQSAGVPVVFFTCPDFSTIHTPRDVASAIEPEELDRVGDLAYATIADLLKQVAPR